MLSLALTVVASTLPMKKFPVTLPVALTVVASTLPIKKFPVTLPVALTVPEVRKAVFE